MNEADIQRLFDLLKDDKLEEVVEYLVKTFPTEENIIQLSGGLQQIRNSNFRGELSNDEIIRYRNIIRNNTFNIIKSIREEKFDREQPVPIHYHSSYENCILPIFILGGFLIFLFVLFSKLEFPSIQSAEFQDKTLKEQTRKLATNNVGNQMPILYTEKKLTGFDGGGRKAEYIVFIVRNFNWALGEIHKSERNGEQSEICEHLSTSGVEARLNREDFKGIICFGNTSVEEDMSLPKNMRKSKEEDRAESRATFLSDCISEVLKSRTPIFKANLGKYNLQDEITNYQREIIIVGIIENDENVINEEALFNGLIDWHLRQDWEIDIREYSKVNQGRIPIERYIN